ncbi:hypothetical protein EWM62_02900 [Mucilaginibacter terrigena]|uniref:Uncharacterized protein n=1 Tax=Mucilaginibacter terrigena TaxID=2492395 RepID=A0A4V1ZCE7_9SPHI|nr:DUF6580 family putative transport protein [Mucilaginibacter terrigena]RYU92400.1 hypothetical protein EWM62_02900 [Mucilaginibacter terrigena]
MLLQKINTRNVVLILIILAATAMRFVSYKYQFLSNFTPVGAIAMFGGVYFTDKWKAYLVILLSLFLSDVVINYLYSAKWTFFSGDTFWNCVCFSIMVFIGSKIKKLNITSGLIILLAPVLVHWLIMDLPWINDALGLYPKTLTGYGSALIAAIPFEKNMLLGDLVFGAILFGGFELAKSKYTALEGKRQLAL